MKKYNNQINENTVFFFEGKKLTLASFMSKFGLADVDSAIILSSTMVEQGIMSIDRGLSKEEALIEVVNKRDKAIRIANDLDDEYINNDIRNRGRRNEDHEMLNIVLDFATTIDATAFDNYIYDEIGPDVETRKIIDRAGGITLEINNISPFEYTKIARKYKTDKAINTVVRTADKGVNTITNGVNKVATDVVAPVATIAGKSVINLVKGVTQTVVKTGTGMFNGGAQAVKDTKVALQTDPEMIRAKRELRENTNALKAFAREKLDKRNRAGGSGITIK